jgi:hypothetical protein
MPDILPNSVYTSSLTTTVLLTATVASISSLTGVNLSYSNLAVSSINNQPVQTGVETESFVVAMSASPSGQVAVSYDGITWFNRGATPGATTSVFGVAWNGSLWVAVGQGGSVVITSPDGINWTTRTGPFTTAGYGIAWNGEVWVAAGYGTVTLAYSFDGISWNSLGASIFTSEGHGVAWNGIVFVATGSGTNTLAYSFDGINWVGVGTTIFSTAGWGVAWNGTLWVAAGQGTNTFATSVNGIDWTGRGATIITSIAYNVAWNGSLWVAVGTGTNTIASSPDGITWTGRTNTLTSGGRSIAWTGMLWVAGGSGTNTLVTSVDGITWVARTVTSMTNITALAARRVLPYVGTYNALLQPTVNIGFNSNATSLQMYGTSGLFNNTVLAEISTGGATQELLIFKGSNSSDRVRFQTTGDVRFETGVSARLWNSNTTTTQSNAIPTMIINASSNVGIRLLSPSFPLDVGGIIRGLTMSTQQVQTSSFIGFVTLATATATSSLASIATSSGTVAASTFTGKWNDAQYYVLQSI